MLSMLYMHTPSCTPHSSHVQQLVAVGMRRARPGGAVEAAAVAVAVAVSKRLVV
jgi:hypothetical protein